jgi:hypothetical protein
MPFQNGQWRTTKLNGVYYPTCATRAAVPFHCASRLHCTRLWYAGSPSPTIYLHPLLLGRGFYRMSTSEGENRAHSPTKDASHAVTGVLPCWPPNTTLILPCQYLCRFAELGPALVVRADTRGVINLIIVLVLCTASSSIPSAIFFATIPERIVNSAYFYTSQPWILSP